MSEALLSLDDVNNIPRHYLPMLCLANGFTSLFGLLIALRTKQFWTHLQWLYYDERGENVWASQWWYFRTFPIDHCKKYSLKLWWSPAWTMGQRELLNDAIKTDLEKPWYRTLYDVPGVVGQLFGLDWFNVGDLHYCSETSDILKLVGIDCGAHPTPEDVNTELKRYAEMEVFGRVQPG